MTKKLPSIRSDLQMHHALGLQTRITHQLEIHGAGCFPAFRDSPYHQALPTSHIACSKNVLDRRLIIFRPNVTAVIEFEPQLFHHSRVLRMNESYRQQSQVTRQHPDGSFYFHELMSSGL